MTAFQLDEQIRRVIVAIQPQWSARHIHFDMNLKETGIMGDYDLLHLGFVGDVRERCFPSGRKGVGNRRRIPCNGNAIRTY
jgi:hypothetical protein